jgi:hypothetical protein
MAEHTSMLQAARLADSYQIRFVNVYELIKRDLDVAVAYVKDYRPNIRMNRTLSHVRDYSQGLHCFL